MDRDAGEPGLRLLVAQLRLREPVKCLERQVAAGVAGIRGEQVAEQLGRVLALPRNAHGSDQAFGSQPRGYLPPRLEQ